MKKTVQQKLSQTLQKRILIVAVCFLIAFLAIVTKSAYLQVFQSSWLSDKAARQYEQNISIAPSRGTIFDRNQVELAVTIDTVSVAAYPQWMLETDKKEIAKTLAQILKLPEQEVIQKLSGKRFVWIKRQTSPMETLALEKLKLKGVEFIPEYSRFYPNRNLAGQLIGFVGIDGRGLEGIEYSYNEFLEGEKEDLVILRDALGQHFDANSVRFKSGNDVYLTIDRNIQYITESALKTAVEKYNAESGMAMVMEPSTGNILAMANVPLLNPNAYNKADKSTWRNHCVTDVFEPGSTIKIFNVSIALESDKFTPSTKIFCENGQYKIGPNTIHDTHSYGWLTLSEVLEKSSNIGFVKIAQTLGAEKQYDGLKRFGFAQKTNIPCPAETTGMLRNYKNWVPIDMATISFGQGISVSTIQLTTALNAIANNGVMMKPRLITKVVSPEGKILQKIEPTVIRRVLSKETAQQTTAMMRGVVVGGTGKSAAIEGYTTCGKTGTAQRPTKSGNYKGGGYIASFIGFAPAENPEIAVVVAINGPRGQYYGGVVAAPVFRQIVVETLGYMGVRPQQLKKDAPQFGSQQSSVLD